jgi:hypothetical protein
MRSTSKLSLVLSLPFVGVAVPLEPGERADAKSVRELADTGAGLAARGGRWTDGVSIRAAVALAGFPLAAAGDSARFGGFGAAGEPPRTMPKTSLSERGAALAC